jgi:hypothetical protein
MGVVVRKVMGNWELGAESHNASTGFVVLQCKINLLLGLIEAVRIREALCTAVSCRAEPKKLTIEKD